MKERKEEHEHEKMNTFLKEITTKMMFSKRENKIKEERQDESKDE